MAKLKFLAKRKKFKVKHNANFLNRKLVDFKFWLIALSPFLFFLYNHIRKRRKIPKKKESFYPVVALYFFSVVVAAVFFALVIGDNIQYAQVFVNNNALAADNNSSNSYLGKIRAATENYIYKNIAKLAKANTAGGGRSVVDSVSFIADNRALVFYHENQDKYLAELIFDSCNGHPRIKRFILKVKNSTDYSHGVYGAD